KMAKAAYAPTLESDQQAAGGATRTRTESPAAQSRSVQPVSFVSAEVEPSSGGRGRRLVAAPLVGGVGGARRPGRRAPAPTAGRPAHGAQAGRAGATTGREQAATPATATRRSRADRKGRSTAGYDRTQARAPARALARALLAQAHFEAHTRPPGAGTTADSDD